MKEDRLEQFISENRSAFNEAEAPLGHFGRFDAKLARATEETAPTKKSSYRWLWGAAASAACIILIVGFGMGRVSTTTTFSDLANVSNSDAFSLAQFTTMEQESDLLIEDKIGEIKLHVNEHNRDYISKVIADYQVMVTEFEQLKSEFKKTGNRRVGDAIVQNVRSREAFLNHVLSNVNERTNNNVYNTNYQTTASLSSSHGNCCSLFEVNNVSAHGGEVLFGELRRRR